MLTFRGVTRYRTTRTPLGGRRLAGQTGLEPATCGFGDRCATNCATALRDRRHPESLPRRQRSSGGHLPPKEYCTRTERRGRTGPRHAPSEPAGPHQVTAHEAPLSTRRDRPSRPTLDDGPQISPARPGSDHPLPVIHRTSTRSPRNTYPRVLAHPARGDRDTRGRHVGSRGRTSHPPRAHARRDRAGGEQGPAPRHHLPWPHRPHHRALARVLPRRDLGHVRPGAGRRAGRAERRGAHRGRALPERRPPRGAGHGLGRVAPERRRDPVHLHVAGRELQRVRRRRRDRRRHDRRGRSPRRSA